ncbi:MAG: pyrroline-5-carboxylate reductase [Nanoarchaeota archaeon]|nr:pyrroline-5-carboxylate reductase [Nanoarchaeota archaeon]
MLNKSIGFIGCGKMASALISCIYNKKLSKSMIVSDRNNTKLKNVKKQFKIKTTKDSREVVKSSDMVFICVKPYDIDDVLEKIKYIVKNQLVVSIAAGIKISHLEKKLKNKRVIRVMPNINCLVGEMAAGFSAGKYATKEDINEISKILNSAGLAFFVKEDLLDIVGAISGSGPAFFAYFINAFVESGVKQGLPKEVAFKLASQTALGTGKLLMKKNLSPDEVIAMVASKKGITIEGLKILKKHNVKNILIKTINAAVRRSKELGK